MPSNSQVALARTHLLGELRSGLRRPGADIVVKEVAQSLRLSPTPVREALERLVGEGLVATGSKRSGFSVPRYSARGLADLLDFDGVLLQNAYVRTLEASEPRLPINEARALAEPAEAIEQVIMATVSGCRNLALLNAVRRSANVLAPYRRMEPGVIPGWLSGLDAFSEALRSGIDARRSIKAFVKRRVTSAAALVDASDQP